MEKDLKDILLKDLCARLPYGVKCKVVKYSIDGEMLFIRNGLELTVDNVKELVTNNMYEIKPYLFPLSSMTEEQKEELKDLISQETNILIEQLKNDDCGIDCGKYHFHSTLELEWLLKNQFDFRGLIEKGLALDATGLNIY